MSRTGAVRPSNIGRRRDVDDPLGPSTLLDVRPDSRWRSLPSAVQRIWRLESTVAAVILLVLLELLFVVTRVLHAAQVWHTVIGASAAAVVAASLLEVLYVVPLRHSSYRYRIADSCITISKGRLFARVSVFPLHQVLFIERRQGPFLRRSGLVRIHVGTIADPYTVGPLSRLAATEFEVAVKTVCGRE